MGIDMTTFVEVREAGGWRSLHLDEAIQKDFRAASFRQEIWAEDDNEVAKRLQTFGYKERNYRLFAAISGAANNSLNIPKVATVRGLPKDMGIIATEYLEHSSGIYPTWLTLAELFTYDWNAYDIQAPDFLVFLDVLKAMGEPEDVRVIFTFFQ